MSVNKTSIAKDRFVILFLISCFAMACDPEPAPGRSEEFDAVPLKASIQPGVIDEASGITESFGLAGYLWTLQDSGQPSSLYLLAKDGKSIRAYGIPGAINHDWEDLTAGPGPKTGVRYVYIADIGNNNPPMTETNIIYRIPEIIDVNGTFDGNQLDKIKFRYPDGPRDAETVLLDSATKDIFIISKELAQTGVYRLPFPQSTSAVTAAEKIGVIPSVTMATGGDMTTDGKEIAVRTYLSVFYWKRKDGESVGQALVRNATKQLPIALEPQGEGICFDHQANGFYTLSEKGSASGVSLNYYKRK